MLSKYFKLFKKVTAIQFIVFLSLLFGNYYQISKATPIKYWLKLYCICFCLIFLSIFCYIFTTDEESRFIPVTSFFGHILNSMVSLFFFEECFLKYCSATKTFDRIMGFKEIPLITNSMYIVLFITAFMRIAIIILLAFEQAVTGRILLCNCIIEISENMNDVIVTLFFSIMHSRMNLLRSVFDRNPIPINIIGRNEVAASIYNLRKCLYGYNNLLENMQSSAKQLHYWLSVYVATIFIKMFTITYYVVKFYMEGGSSSYTQIAIVSVLQISFLVTSTGIFAEATASEVGDIKRILTMQLIRCSDESLRFELETALQYVTLRPFSFKICRIIPVNMSLPFTLISLCITYVIITMQITHLA